ncbi:Copper homeostasis protein CutC [Seminavis robusta]|uniref:Copper homeostasis protein cutC homolog n=1 Tax=Seminavis robusta TaxID=568900 RepID=A0A9N8F0Z8_9STRA|nr:Copper homeostasis protein CutC [Seminavis robusta]|eukprot:Sro2977_g341410.1 Copper homeostasis protein CutC (254) ;mRNA; f:7983-8744
MTELEVCIDSVEGAKAASRYGATRVELCANLNEGGTTPSAGMIAMVHEALATTRTTELYVMIRPRGGNFVYSQDELSVMKRDIQMARQLGADGVVLGCLTEGATTCIDVPVTKSLVQLAHPLPVTFHRAFDRTNNPTSMEAMLEAVIQTGAKRILTSGLAPSVEQGTATLKKLTNLAEGRIAIMAGCGVRPDNVKLLVKTTNVQAVHFTARRKVLSRQEFNNIPMGASAEDDIQYEVDHEKMEAIRQALQELS